MQYTAVSPYEHHLRFDSLLDFRNAHKPGDNYGKSFRRDFAGVSSRKEAHSLAVNGVEGAEVALSIAENVIETVEGEHDVPAFKSVWDVSGSEVDVSRYLAGEPENMIDYEMIKTPRYGRVVTLVASVSFSCAISTEAIERRGHAIVALALALSRLGFASELYADLSISGGGWGGKTEVKGHTRILVKGPNDELDPARLMFAFAHPAMLRALGFDAQHNYPRSVKEDLSIGESYGMPINPKEDMPEGTIYLPCLLSDRDVPEAQEALVTYMKNLGIIDQ